MNPEARQTVLFSTRRHAMVRNPYIEQLAQHLEELGVEVKPWSWRTALTRRYDLLHVHWPEYVIGHRRRVLAIMHALLSSALLARLRRRRIPVVRTLHNHTPHFVLGRRAQSRLGRLESLTTHTFHLHRGNEGPSDSVVPHGHYQDWFAKFPRAEMSPGRILFFGLIRSYKNVPALISAFRETSDSSLSLVVIGESESAELAQSLASQAAPDSRISLDLKFADDNELAWQISSASLVVLPYSEVFNSGAALLALSLGRRILVADSPTMRSLADEVGDGWVQTFTGAITASDLTAALNQPRCLAEPDLSQRSWPDAARAHAAGYSSAIQALHPKVRT